MTYKLRPMYGIKESFFGPAAYREAEFYQSTHPNNPAQSLAVGDSIDHPTIEGFEKTIRPQPGTKQELMGAGVVAYAQAFQKFAAEQGEAPEPAPEYEAVTFTSTTTTTYTPEFAENTYYKTETVEGQTVYVLVSSEPEDWGTGTYYTRKGADPDYTYKAVTFTPHSTTTYSPEFAANTYYKKEGEAYVLLSSQPEDWGTGTYYKVKEAE